MFSVRSTTHPTTPTSPHLVGGFVEHGCDSTKIGCREDGSEHLPLLPMFSTLGHQEARSEKAEAMESYNPRETRLNRVRVVGLLGSTVVLHPNVLVFDCHIVKCFRVVDMQPGALCE